MPAAVFPQSYTMSLDVSAVADNQVKNARTGEMVAVKSLYNDKTALIVFFRRWGCVFCRVWARQLAELYPLLKENNIRLIGVGVDEIGLEDFLKGNHFPGELYIDSNKTVYSGLNLKRFNYLSIMLSLFTGESRGAIWKGRDEKMGGDLKGDGLQNGGALVVKKGGEVLFSFRQERPAEHVPNEKFAEVLGLKYTANPVTPTENVSCDDECAR